MPRFLSQLRSSTLAPLLWACATLLSLSAGAAPAQAAGAVAPPVTISGVPSFSSFTELFDKLRESAATIAIYVGIIFVVIAGFMYITARGDENEAKKARESMVNIAFGLGFVGIAQTAVVTIGKVSNNDFQGAASEFWGVVLEPIVNAVSTIALGWTILMFIIAGFGLVTSKGTQEDWDKARHRLQYGAYGLLTIGIAKAAIAVFAVGGNLNGRVVNILDPGEQDTFTSGFDTTILTPVLNVMTYVALGFAVIMFIMAGYKLVTSGKDDAKRREAYNSLFYGAIGLVIVGMSSSVVNIFRRDAELKKVKDILSTADYDAFKQGFEGGLISPVLNIMTYVVLGIAAFMFILAGYQLITSQGDDAKKKAAYHQLLYGAIGLVVVGLARSAVEIFKGGTGILDVTQGTELGQRFETSILSPLLTFITSFVGSVAIFMFVLAGYKLLTSQGDDAKKKEAYNELQFGVTGLLVIGLAQTAIRSMFIVNDGQMTVKTSEGVKLVITLVNFALSFLGSVSIAMVVYAGFLVLTDAGDGNRKKQGTSILQYSIIGILIILFSYSIVNIFVTGGR